MISLVTIRRPLNGVIVFYLIRWIMISSTTTPVVVFALTPTDNNLSSIPPLSGAARLRLLLTTKKAVNSSIALPGVHDALSAKIFADSGAEALFLR